jgi:O-antigen ligase
MRLSRAVTGAGLLLPGALTLFLAFSGGGFFAGTTALVALVLAIALLLRSTLVVEPFAWPTGGFAVAAAGLALFAIWVLVSGAWSGAPARALLEFDRALLYLLAFVLFGSFLRSPARLRMMLGGIAIAIFLVCAVALVSRAAPDVLHTSAGFENERLSYPVTYWNTLGLLAALGLIFCFHLASSEREPRLARVLGAAAAPVLGATLILTFSRGAIAVLVGGLLAYAIAGRPRSLLVGVIAAVPGGIVAGVLAYGAELLAAPNPTTPAAVAQGHRLLVGVGLCTLACGVVRCLFLPLDARLARFRMSRRVRSLVYGAAAVLSVMALLVAAVALDAPNRIDRQYHRFVAGDQLPRSRERLTRVSNNSRLSEWKVALDAYRGAPLHGAGAGTYPTLWTRHRPSEANANDAHSLYVETLGELGLVGLGLLLVAVVTVLAVLGLRCRGPDRAVYGGLFAAGLAWAVHAGIDWDWEMPVTTLWLFAVGGAALAAPAGDSALLRSPARLTRVLIGLACLIVSVTPARVAISQHRLDAGVVALKQDHCAQAINSALASNRAVGDRPEPFELLGYCDIRLGAERLGVRMMMRAVSRDPDNWELRYGLAVARAAAGLDPRPATRQALQLNPRSGLVQRSVALFDTSDPAKWRRRALRAPLPLG